MKKTRTFLSLLLAVLMLVGVFGGVYADSYTLIGVKIDSGGIEYSSTFHGFVYDSNSFNFVWKGDKSPDEGCAPLTSGVYNDKGLNETCTDTDIATKDTYYIGIGITRMNGAPINVAPEAKNIQFTMTGYTADYVGVEEKKNDEYSAIYMVFKIKSTLPRYTINGLSVTGSGFTYSDEEQAYVMNDPKFSFNWKDKKAPKSYTTCVTAVYCSDDLWRTTSKEDFETAPFYIGIGLAQDNSYTLTTDSGVEKSFNLTIPGYVAKYSRMIHKDGYIYLMFQVNKIDDKVYTATGVTVKANGIKYFEVSVKSDVNVYEAFIELIFDAYLSVKSNIQNMRQTFKMSGMGNGGGKRKCCG